MEKHPYFFINSLEKSVKILETLAKWGELSVSEIGCKVGMHRGAVHRFLATLRELGLLEQSKDSRYRLSMKLFEIGMSVDNRFEVRQIAHPFLVDLQSRYEETANLAILDGIEVIFLDKVESNHLLRMDLSIGHRVPSYCTALGKVMLAYLPEKEVRRLFHKVKLEPRTPNTITILSELIEHLDEIKTKGYAISAEEIDTGISAIAAPIFDYTETCIAAISIAGPAQRLTREIMEKMAQDLSTICKTISIRLGYMKLNPS